MPVLRLGTTLGEGGTSVVKQATQIPLWREVAVKILRNNRTQGLAALELLREALIMSALEHPNILPIHSLGCDGTGSPMLVMRRVQGVAWSQLLAEPSHPLWDRYAAIDRFDFHLDVLLQVCKGISYAHSKGIVHRDLKPENVMIGEFGEVYVLDWGIAVTIRDEPTGLLPKNSEIRHIAGTPENMAPEMANGDGPHITEKTDVYLLGAMLHRCLTGKPRHEGKTIFDLLREAHVSDPVRYPTSVPAELAVICNKATHVEPEKRFHSAEEFRQAIVDFRRHQSSAALSSEARQRLELLKEALDSSCEDRPDRIHRLFDECRFGFQQALKTWPSNREAAQGLQEAIEIMARREIERKDARAAAVLIAEMHPAPPELVQLVSDLEERLEQDRQEVTKLRRMQRELDPEVGRRYRASYVIMIAVVFGIIHFLTGLCERLGWVRVTMEVLQIEVLFFLILSCGFMWLMRHVLSQTEVNRRIRNMLVLLLFLMLSLTFACKLLGIGVHSTVVLIMLLCAITIAALTVTVERRLFWASGFYFLGFMAGARFPEMVFEIVGVANVAALVQIAMVWRAPPKAAG